MRDHTDVQAAPPLPVALRAALDTERRQDLHQVSPRTAAEFEGVLLAALTLIAGRSDEGAAELAGATLDRVAPYLEKRRRDERMVDDVVRIALASGCAPQQIAILPEAVLRRIAEAR